MGASIDSGGPGPGQAGELPGRDKDWSRAGRGDVLLRLYRMRLASAFLIVLPILFLCAWYAFAAIVEHLRYNAASGQQQALTWEIFHIHLHDRLSRDFRRLVMPAPSGASDLPLYALVVGNTELDILDKSVPPGEGAGAYVDAYLKKGRELREVRVRYRGRKHWHWSYAQKTWKIRMKKRTFLDGLDSFMFLNTAEPLPVDEEIVMDVAREEGLLTPQYFPFRLLLNNNYMGVYFFYSHPDEGLLRNGKRMPGSIYSGNAAPKDEQTGVSALWKSPKYWKKLAARDPHQMAVRTDLEALIEVVDRGTQREFARFARDHLDLEKFALFDALDVVFGGNQHDFGSNHKLYFDPYKGKFEPIAWNFRGWKHRRQLNRTENPLLIRLKDLPSYVTERNKIAAGLLGSTCSPRAVRERAESLIGKLAADQASDPYWDAYDLLPPVSKYMRQMVRPMNEERQAVILGSRMSMFDRRTAFLQAELGRLDVSATLALTPGSTLPDGVPAAAILAVTVDGMSGFRLDSLSASWDADCRPEHLEIFSDSNLSGALEPGPDRVVTPRLQPNAHAALHVDLFPGTVLLDRGSVHETRGGVNAAPDARTYRFFIQSGKCGPRSVDLAGLNLVSGQAISISATRTPSRPLAAISCADEGVVMGPGHRSLHPWCLAGAREEEVHLGPGSVSIDHTRVFGPKQRVVIEPGTTLLMGQGASLVFQAKVKAVGEADAPIRILPSGGSWGGIVLQGAATTGSRLRHVHAFGGTRPEWSIISFPGMINVHDTRDIAIADSRFGRNSLSDDVLHVAYTVGLEIAHTDFVDSAADAVDLEFSEGRLAGLRIVGTRDECLDFMGSKIKLTDSILLGCRASAISAGEETEIEAKDTLVADSTRGLLVKNASQARLERVLFYRDETAVQVVRDSDRYTGKSGVKANRLHAFACGKTLVVDGGKNKGADEILDVLPPDDLAKLRRNVLSLQRWSDLDALIVGLRKESGE